MPTSNPPPQDHFDPNAFFSRTKYEQDAYSRATRPQEGGSILSRWWPTGYGSASAAKVVTADDSGFERDRSKLSSNNQSAVTSNIATAAAGAQRAFEQVEDTADTNTQSALSGIRRWWSGAEEETDGKRVDWRSNNNLTAVRDFRDNEVETPFPNAQQRDWEFVAPDAMENMGNVFDEGIALRGKGDLSGRGEDKNQRFMKESLDLVRGGQGQYLSRIRESGKCAFELGDYEQCLASSGGDATKCKGMWDKFLSCQEDLSRDGGRM